jgi:hypothetical protein
LLTIIVLSIVTIRIGSVALELTGLASEIAPFQAQSAFSGIGFTTDEAEQAVSHPVRRRIIRILMLLGSAGVSSSFATLILTFINQEGGALAYRIGVLLIGLCVIFFLARSKYLTRLLKRSIVTALDRWTNLRLFDYEQLLGLCRGFTICKITVKPDSWMEGRRLKEIDPDMEGVLVLAIQRVVEGEERFIGAPHGSTIARAGDTVICYSRQEVSQELSRRGKSSKGDEEHQRRVDEERRLAKEREYRGYTNERD